MADEILPQGQWRSLIEEYPQNLGVARERLDLDKTVFRVFQHGRDLIGSHSWKPLEELINGSARFKVFEQRPHGYSRAFKNPRPA